MSRSYRYTPITGISCAPSDRIGKRVSSGRVRAEQRNTLTSQAVDFDLLAPSTRDMKHKTVMPKEGKQFLTPQRLRRTQQICGIRYVMKTFGQPLVRQANHQGARHD